MRAPVLALALAGGLVVTSCDHPTPPARDVSWAADFPEDTTALFMTIRVENGVVEGSGLTGKLYSAEPLPLTISGSHQDPAYNLVMESDSGTITFSGAIQQGSGRLTGILNGLNFENRQASFRRS
jgi:hypothetical protein